MRLRFLPLMFVLLLAACVDTTGLSKETSRTPKGNPNAAVVVTEFADLQCPSCKAASTAIVAPLLQQFGSTIRFEYMHFPLRTLHPHALNSALGAECAADQGKFWEFTDKAYIEQDKMSKDRIKAWANELGLDMDLFNRCVASKIKQDTILADYEKGRELGVNGTPTFFINGKRVKTDLQKMIDAINAAQQGAMQRL
ncbi:MAG TPA: thioredoxin domain-containing protein [Candidatus Peribacteraceae bacterium]|nr:thioredoxin domain-containing protein [Candidatus Peribacteraceae bacterium]